MKSHKKEIITVAILMAAAVVIFAGILKPEATQTKKCSLIYIPKIRDNTNDFWTSVISGCKMAAEEYESDLEILAPDKEENIEEQNKLLKKAIEQKPDAILFSPSSMDASDELLKEAKEKGIRITYIDSYTKEKLQDLTVATDNVNAGRMLGEYARKLIDKDSKIAIVSHVKGVSTAVEREQGFREGLGDYADNIVDIVYCNSLYEKSYELAQELMRKYPDLELIAGMNEYSAVGVGIAQVFRNLWKMVKPATASGHGIDDDEPFSGIGRHAAIIFRERCAACRPGSRRTSRPRRSPPSRRASGGSRSSGRTKSCPARDRRCR